MGELVDDVEEANVLENYSRSNTEINYVLTNANSLGLTKKEVYQKLICFLISSLNCLVFGTLINVQ